MDDHDFYLLFGRFHLFFYSNQQFDFYCCTLDLKFNDCRTICSFVKRIYVLIIKDFPVKKSNVNHLQIESLCNEIRHKLATYW